MSASVASITGVTGSLLGRTDHGQFPLSAIAGAHREMGPLSGRDRVVGTLGLVRAEHNPYSEDELDRAAFTQDCAEVRRRSIDSTLCPSGMENKGAANCLTSRSPGKEMVTLLGSSHGAAPNVENLLGS